MEAEAEQKLNPELVSEPGFDQAPDTNESKEADYKPNSEPEYRKWLTVFGGFLVCLSFGSGKVKEKECTMNPTFFSDFSYPNLNTYMTSYMRQTGYNSCLSYTTFTMLIASKMILQGVSMPFIGNIANKLGPR